MAILQKNALEVAKKWQKNGEIPGRSGNEIPVLEPLAGNTGKPQEETSDSSGITKEAKASFFLCLITSKLDFFTAKQIELGAIQTVKQPYPGVNILPGNYAPVHPNLLGLAPS